MKKRFLCLPVVLLLLSVLYEVQVDIQLCDTDTAEDVLGVTDNILGVSVGGHLQLQTAAVVVAGQGPEMGLL